MKRRHTIKVRGIPGENELQRYRNAKSTLVVGVRRTLNFDTSKPSAEYAIPLATGCMGHCHDCYLQATLGSKPYICVYANLDDIFAQAENILMSALHKLLALRRRVRPISSASTICTICPIRFIVVTEMAACVLSRNMSILAIYWMRNITEKRAFVSASIPVMSLKILSWGHLSFDARLEAARKVANSRYPLWFVGAPIYMREGWKEGDFGLFERLYEKLGGIGLSNLVFELIQHRFAKPAKK